MAATSRDDHPNRHAPPFDVLVVGAGPAGLSVAIHAKDARPAARVAVLERLDAPGRRLLVTGGGHANLTHEGDVEHFVRRFGRRGRFVRPTLAAFGVGALRDWLAGLGVPTAAADGEHYYPVSRRAGEVLAALLRATERRDVAVLRSREAAAWTPPAPGAPGELLLADGRRLAARTLVLASGGLSYPELGGHDSGHRLARRAGHRITPTVPGLVGLRVAAPGLGDGCLAGIVLPDARATPGCDGRCEICRLAIPAKGSTKATGAFGAECLWAAMTTRDRRAARRALEGFTARGPLLLTHRGVSGPAVLDASAEFAARLDRADQSAAPSAATGGDDPDKQDAHAAENGGAGRFFLPLTVAWSAEMDDSAWRSRLAGWRRRRGGKTARALLAECLPERLARWLAERAAGASSSMPSAAAPMAQWPADALRVLVDELAGCVLPVVGTEGWSRAMVTRGGIDVDEVESRTLASRLAAGLYFAGEALDVDGPCGGYNLHWAFASGAVAGRNAMLNSDC